MLSATLQIPLFYLLSQAFSLINYEPVSIAFQEFVVVVVFNLQKIKSRRFVISILFICDLGLFNIV